MNSPALIALMPVVCAWCDKQLAPKPCVPAMAGRVSHGICAVCAERERARVRELGPADFAADARRAQIVCRVA